MNRSLVSRLDKLEPTEEGRTHIIWRDYGMSDADIEREIAGRKAAGTLGPLDKLLIAQWQGDGP